MFKEHKKVIKEDLNGLKLITKRWKNKDLMERLNTILLLFKIVLIITGLNAFFEIVKLFATLKMYGLI